MKTFTLISALVIGTLSGLSAFALGPSAGENQAEQILRAFNHRRHETRVFTPNSVACSSCHNFTLNDATGEVTPSRELSKSAFSKTFKSICHECHKTADVAHRDAPKGCTLCHRSVETMASIAPPNHRGASWRQSHATDARANGSACLDCHTSSQCVKCHLQRSDIEMQNHSRNFRFYHSVQARLEPQKCDTCHTKTYCTNCHQGKK